eukprot:TRINITY_DN15577_c0_g1_i1.p1 TRINITY_DN15577_c0_g1~~TRINITY_DN15577_c0_g1_i1.p1  ORF type:complete len:720 (-),score=123.09 TRINITY_DN15577_c0_g1_i1:112-2121(-)
MVGAEYTPWRASNELWWHEYQSYRRDVIREVRLAKEVMGFTTLRMFLHTMLYADNAEKLKTNIGDFLDICEQEGFKAGFVFFDDCWRHSGADLDSKCVPRKGVHNGCWMASPQDVERTDVDRFKPYVSDIVRTFRADKRVAWWEIFNEPQRNSSFTMKLRHAAFGWAKAQNPTQPVISCWDDSEDTEIVDRHQYEVPWGADNPVFSNPAKGGIVTEAGARWFQKTPTDAGSPLTVVSWLTALRKSDAAPFVPGVMIDWEVMVGHSQTRWHWGDPEGSAEPPIPWHNHIYPDGTPVSFTEAAAIRRYVTGKDEFLFVETFLSDDAGGEEKYLTLPPGDSFKSSGVIATEALYELTFWPEGPSQRMASCNFIGENKEFVGTDVDMYPYSGSTDEEKDASCCNACEDDKQCEFWVRSTETQECWLRRDFLGFTDNSSRRGPEMTPAVGASSKLTFGVGRFHNVTIDNDRLTLENSHGQVAYFDVSQVEGGVVMKSWNMLRVLVQTNRVRVWFNPQFSDVTGDSVPPADEITMVPMPPRIDVATTNAIAGDFVIFASTQNRANVRVDYVSVLPPKLYGLAAEEEGKGDEANENFGRSDAELGEDDEKQSQGGDDQLRRRKKVVDRNSPKPLLENIDDQDKDVRTDASEEESSETNGTRVENEVQGGMGGYTEA